jgi:methylated-DNA-protein-cysteine methyltransferase-like protein
MATKNDHELAIRGVIASIPAGKVATYGQVAEAAGYPHYHRQVAQVLRKYGDALPWHRVLGAGGQIKTGLGSALEQRLRLKMEGVSFRGARVDMGSCTALLSSAQRGSRPPAAIEVPQRERTDGSRQPRRRVQPPGRAKS